MVKVTSTRTTNILEVCRQTRRFRFHCIHGNQHYYHTVPPLQLTQSEAYCIEGETCPQFQRLTPRTVSYFGFDEISYKVEVLIADEFETELAKEILSFLPAENN